MTLTMSCPDPGRLSLSEFETECTLEPGRFGIGRLYCIGFHDVPTWRSCNDDAENDDAGHTGRCQRRRG